MLNILYANPYSLLDYTSGSSKSIRLILKGFSKLGCNVEAIFCTTSYSKTGYLNTCAFLNNSNRSEKLNHINLDGIKCKIINSNHWDRRKLSDLEKCLFLKETIYLIRKRKIDLIISWGNLSLEEEIFKEAKKLGVKICFYLVNPSYFGEDFYLKDNADFIITDSNATKRLYENFIKNKINVLPKCLEEIPIRASHKNKSKNCLIINPSINKGLEPLIEVSKKLYIVDPSISLWCVNGRDQIYDDLKYLKYQINDLPKNIKILPACKDIQSLYDHVKVVFLLSIWHESGSRVIQESYAKGLPVICFNTGGNDEYIQENKKDIFEMPRTYLDKNNRLRIKKWDSKKMVERISLLVEDEQYYGYYSGKILKENNPKIKNKVFFKSLSEFVNFIKGTKK